MSDDALFKMPTIDLSAKSLLMLSQLGIFMVFAYWSIEDGAGDNLDYVFFAMMSAAGLALFFSVPNARMGVTLGIPAVMVVMGLATGEYGIMFWAVFMLLMIGPIAYMPALASGDSTLDLDDESRKMRLGILWIVFALFMMAMMSELLVMAVDGEVTEEDEDGNDVFTMTLDSTQQTIAQIGLAIGVIGVLVFLLTALVGMELGPMLPWHGGAMAAGAMLISQYLWSVGEGAPSMVAGDIAFILCIIGLTILPPCIAYRSE
ncbi:MAG: hypothetical protein P8Q35_01775 [Candidatus Thalassarchaeaceae archaeon]|nr:hypothetical protein [Candidatus Thalassarchaeaceae archaeon]